MTDLGDLNIVAIPSQPKQQLGTTKRKKNNKYERRRQNAIKAKNRSLNDTNRSSKRYEFAEENEDTVVANDVMNTQEEGDRIIRKESANKGRSIIDDSANNSSIDSGNVDSSPLTNNDDPANRSIHDSTKEKDIVRKDQPTNGQTTIPHSAKVETASVSADKPTRKQRRDTDNENPVVVVNNQQLSRSQQPLPSPPSQRASAHTKTKGKAVIAEEERAKYMAEFHARPRELDRRSGARSATIISRESTHLFIDKNDWQSLQIHPRLIQAINSPQFGSLSRPTTIQSRTIQAFQLQESQKDEAPEKVNKRHRNVLIHSETGSGKTLAYVLPILQSLAFGNDNSSKGEQRKLSRSEMGCRCIILCPTRELAIQTLLVLERLCQANFAGWIVPGGLFGGDSRNSEKSRLRKGLGIIVATPGRLLDHLHKTTSLAMSLKGKLQWLVLDEADRLLDMGLGDQVRQIVQWIRANEASKAATQPWWRSVLVSATVTPSVEALAKERMLCGNQDWVWVKGEDGSKSSKVVSEAPSSQQESTDWEASTSTHAPESSKHGSDVTSEDFAHSTPRQLQQLHLTVTAKLRLSTLVAFLVQRIAKNERTVVFMGTCSCVDYHHYLFSSVEESLWDDDKTDYSNLDGSGNGRDDADTTAKVTGLFGKKARIFKLHGSVPHAKRCQTMKEFSSTTGGPKLEAAVLLTTDVAARGLNLEGIDWIVQYDPPCEISDYVHRVGRVARAGKAGHSLLFLLPSERKYLEVLETKGISNLTPLPLSSVLNQAASICSEWAQSGAKQGGEQKRNYQDPLSANSRAGEFFCSEVQYRLEECVVQDDVNTRKAWKEKMATASKEQRGKRKTASNTSSGKEVKKEGQLLTMARDAFLSFLRAYPTKKEPAVKAIFSSRALHLGHIAKSFALKEPPKSLVSKQKNKREQLQGEVRDEQANLPRSLAFVDAPDDFEDLITSTGTTKASQTDSSHLDDIDEEGGDLPRPKKRQRIQHNGKPMNAKSLMLANALKIQNNLMDAM